MKLINRILVLGFVLTLVMPGAVMGQNSKPNSLVIMGDDIGIPNISKFSFGMMGYRTANIDRIADGGMFFTDYYAEQSCTAGRAAFITGQIPVRTGMTKVGFPGADLGIRKEDPTLARLLKDQGYMTGQFGKNHLGDKDEFLPTEHGFDEFFGNLYHLQAEEEPENPDYPKNPEFKKRFGPRGVIKSTANGKIEDTGPLTKKRMETVDEEFLAATKDFIQRANKAERPFFTWFNSSRMHYFTHISKKWEGKSGLNFYADGMLEHDSHVGELLDLLDELKITDNTIVIYTTDNGVHYNEWPDAGVTWFRGEKNTNWEGGFRVPTIVRWPNKIPANSVSNEIMSHADWLPTLMAAVGVTDIKESLKKGYQSKSASRTYKVHLDGYNVLPILLGEKTEWPRKEFFYFSDDGELLALRHDRWKIVFAEQRARAFAVWRDPFTKLRAPKIFDLRMDPFERADTDSNNYDRWWGIRAFLFSGAQKIVGDLVATFKEFPPRQKPAKFNVEDAINDLADPISN